MANINLLPPEYRRRNLDLGQKLMFIGIVGYILFLLVVFVNNYLQITHLQIEKEALQQQLSIVEPKLENITDLEKEQQNLRVKLQVIKQFDREVYYFQLLVLTSDLLPEGVGLSKLKYDGESLSYEGEAVDYRDVAEFMDRLRASESFTDVELISSFTTHNQSSIAFKITARLTIKD